MFLGSGLGNLADEIGNPISIPFSKIPHFAKSEAIGHADELIIGELIGKTAIAMKVLGISCLTNMACGILDQPLNHDEVIEVVSLAREKFIKLVTESIARM